MRKCDATSTRKKCSDEEKPHALLASDIASTDPARLTLLLESLGVILSNNTLPFADLDVTKNIIATITKP
jgi:hypothetical protein